MSLSGLIERHALARPEAVAVTNPTPDGGELTLSYGELSRAADRFAAELTELGVLPGDRVVTALRPGPELVTALLGILRAGASYVPLDPALPAGERLRDLVRDTSARAVVTGLGVAEIVRTPSARPAPTPSRTPSPHPTVSPIPDTAYLRRLPDGTCAAVSHRALLELVGAADPVRLTREDVVAQTAGPDSSAFAFEVWSTLAAGARLVVLDRGAVAEPARFEEAVAQQGVSVFFLPTALFQRIARERPGAFAPLRTVLFGGEACDPRTVREVLRAAAGAPERLVQVYGAPGAAPFALWHEVSEVPEGARTVPIGRPREGVSAVVVTGDGTAAGPGGTGELLLGGEDGRDGAALLRTGDLVTVREDGDLEFAGRAADRVTVHGIPVELGAVEAALREHPGVAEAVVTLAGEPAGELVAHVVPATAAVAQPARIGEWKEIYAALYADARAQDPYALEAFADAMAAGPAATAPVPDQAQAQAQAQAVRERRAATVERVRGLGRRRILEIGAGTGLLMGPLAADAQCEEYWATDFCGAAVEALRTRTRDDERLRDKVRLSRREAHDTAGLPAGYFDTVVLNSVVQHFPGLGYLRTVVARALDLLAPGGSLLLGDLRPLDRSAGRDPELRIDPALFTVLAREFPAIRTIDVRTAPGTGGRYEVVLGTAGPAGPAPTATDGGQLFAAEACVNVPVGFARAGSSPAQLRAYLQARVPDHMVPDTVVVHDALPLDPGGRTDRTALAARPPADAGDRHGGGAGAVPVGTPLQGIARDLFAEVLGVPARVLGGDCDFLGLGGHLLAAARLVARARAVLGAAVDLRSLCEAPTPAHLAELAGDGPVTATGPDRAPARSAVLPLRLRGALDVAALGAALEELGRGHRALRNCRIGWAGTRLRELAADDHRLELTLPGDEVDLWSHAPLAAALAAAYAARVGAGCPTPPRPAPPAPPRAMDGEIVPTAAPGSGPLGPDDSFGTLGFDLDASMHGRLTALAAEHGATLFMVVQAALVTLLHRLGSDTLAQVTVAAPVPARDSAALRGAVGPYGRVLALTVDASGDPAFTELLRRVRTAALGAYRDRDAALARPGGIALSVLRESCGAFPAGDALTVLPESEQLPLPAAALGLTLTERHDPAGAPAGIAVTASYAYDCLGEQAAALLTGQLLALLEAALDAPRESIGRLGLKPAEQPAEQPATEAEGLWNGPPCPPQAPTDIAALLAEQVARAPGAPALAGLDYAELDARSDLLAHALIAHRAGPGTSVATAIVSPTGFAVAALAIAKTGAACLPVDPSQGLPAGARPAVLLLDETADMLLAPTPGPVRLVRDPAADLLPVGASWPVRESDRTRPLDPGAPVVLAVAPRGSVAVGGEALAAARRGRARDTAWLLNGYPDAEVALGLLAALVCGAQVHLLDPSLAYGAPHEVLRWLRERNASAILGPSDDVVIALAHAQDTELTISAGWPEGRLLVEQVLDGPARPAPGYHAHVLDARMRPVAPGEVGALYVAGVGVAQGYPGLPGATGERFLPDPLVGAHGAAARMWRTGHAARVAEGGSLHVLDHPWDEDPFADAFGTFVVVQDPAGHRALWPASVPVPALWCQIHGEDPYELCLSHLEEPQLNDHLGDHL
ncbi:AMP-binding protein [Streptomyces sp. NBC_00503]|uniref:AMP-binding protein n=1 Tax=Streptomyces sp. NBC_00503 TaxID=2903659 RepID=UPI002E80DAD2|nr:AMP-binding protein [Streptomyces sp. NBC_00503]WUD86537.1 AMP-binding protein [Streptomyces sp. NBC_00503]